MKYLLIVAASTLLLAGCNADGSIETEEDKAEKRTEVYDYDSNTGLLIDRETGCQYLYVQDPWIEGAAVAPRYESDGKTIMCKK